MGTDRAYLVLQDGTVFEGKPFGAAGEATGETVFYTGVVGYQEVATEPAYAGTITVLTYPIIGSYGVNDEDNESPGTHVRGLVIREYSRTYSNFRAVGDFETFLRERHVVGIREVDTRAVAVHLRDHGEMKGLIASGDLDVEAVAGKLAATPSPWEDDLVGALDAPSVPKPQGEVRHRLVALNVGINRSTLATLAALGCKVTVLPASAAAEKLLSTKPDGLILAGGPGNPNAAEAVVDTVKDLLGKVPILGIGLGHELLALALGCTVERMKVGHHGVNHSVKRIGDGKGEITVQHHSFVVNAKVPAGVEVTHTNVNDGTVEGIRSTKHPAASVQYCPGPDDWGRPNRVVTDFLAGL